MEESESQAESYVEQVTDKHFQDMKGTHRRSTESGEGIKLKGKQNKTKLPNLKNFPTKWKRNKMKLNSKTSHTAGQTLGWIIWSQRSLGTASQHGPTTSWL